MADRSDYTKRAWVNLAPPGMDAAHWNAIESAIASALSTVDPQSISGPLNVISRTVRVGPTDYAVLISLGGPSSGYLIADKANTASDASVLLRDQGAMRAEMGLAADNDLHIKSITGVADSEVFVDAIIVKNDTAYVWVPQRLGVGTVPTELLHIAANLSAGRVMAKIENSATTGSGAVAFELKGRGSDWTFGVDVGLNGGRNFAIQDVLFGYMPRFFIDSAGKVGLATDSPGYGLDVRSGDIAAGVVGNGFRVKEGTNARMGVATLAAGTVVVSTTAVTATSRIMLTAQSLGTVTNPSALCVSARTAGTSFTIKASQATDTSTVAWQIFEPA